MEAQRCLLLFCVLFISIKSIVSLTKEQEADRISALPGQPTVEFAQFSGYITVNKTHGRALFYWLTEATTNPQQKPLVLWLNGGPGCSSIAYGQSAEIGPFRINKTGSSLYLNEYSWNKEANIIFLESPAGVGFSYTNTSSDLTEFGDKRTAEDNLNFLINWFSRFPEYRYRDFYIVGESYAGHYIPQLVKKVYDYNKAYSQPFINLKGFMVGNGATDNYYDNTGTVLYWWSHALISDATYKSILKNCDFKFNNFSQQCNDILTYVFNVEFGNIDIYSIYTPPCPSTQSGVRLKNSLVRRRPRILSGYDPCINNYAEVYYNRPDVQKALHANTTGIQYNWTACSNEVINNWNDSQFTMLSTYKDLIAAGLRIWMYSGDTDSVVPVTGTKFSVGHLKLNVTAPWYPWYAGTQVGGWTEVYKGLTFATVREAGHEVPLFQPERAFILFQSFLQGKELPKS